MINNVFPYSKLFAAKGNEIQTVMEDFVANPEVEPNVFGGMVRPFKYLGKLENTYESSPTFVVDVPALEPGELYEVLVMGSYSKITRNGNSITPLSANSIFAFHQHKGDYYESYAAGFNLVIDRMDHSLGGVSVNYVSVITQVGIVAAGWDAYAGAFSNVVFYGRKVEGEES